MITDRLRIVQLDIPGMEAFCHGHGGARFERLEGLNGDGSPDDDFAISLNRTSYEALLREPHNAKWYQNWQIIHVADNRVIGGALFKGAPNGKGEVEIGYGLDEGYWNRGYMTEAAIALIRWALAQDGVRAVIAETERDNTASMRVVLKAGMVPYFETDTALWWMTPADAAQDITALSADAAHDGDRA